MATEEMVTESEDKPCRLQRNIRDNYTTCKTMSDPIVQTKAGKVQGIKLTTPVFSTEYYAFYGIPYAQPPLNKLRFQDPVKIQPWKIVRNATTPKDACLQYSHTKFTLIGSEDCLFVNVYTTELPEVGVDKPLKPVMVLVHPGSQLWGSPNPDHQGSPNYIMQHDVVYVTIGFRLNIFGFLNLGLKECSGNQGLKDIVMALQWIQENIHKFNGDPSNVTIMGSSSGSGVVHLLLLSPVTEGLFHKAILMGQYAFNSLVHVSEEQKTMAFEFGQQLGFKGTDPKKLLAFLKKMPAEVIVLKMKPFMDRIQKDLIKSFPGGPFKQCVDSVVLPVSPRQLIPSTRRIPVIFGICEKESALAFKIGERDTVMQRFNIACRQNCWGWMYQLDDNDLNKLYEEVLSFYRKHYPLKSNTLNQKIDILNDVAFCELYETIIDIISADLPDSVYVYKFQYEGELNTFKHLISPFLGEYVEGSFHYDDLSYWAEHRDTDSSKDLKIVYKFTKMFCTFAKTGNPNYENNETHWEPSTPQNPCYLDINEKLKMVDGKLNGERLEFWRSLKKQFSQE